ncbi:methyltransferase domain-containing protein [Halobacterium sp. R2-5]|uniref:methyltransferase domain-containing protein n=1 Tax=Halobacterium sp. R2-5 TaxID=2715751 RepID=UPI00141FF535|nr:methyltransferase domain-containing protein [Halobacterium sp. R2-5]NIC00904.1 methyltransferase domain-containing protein [Halobacterium sp. R2-5]
MVSEDVARELKDAVMATANKQLDVSMETSGRAAEILLTAAKEVSTHAHGVNNVCAAALLVACRQHDEPVTMTEVVEAWEPVDVGGNSGEEFSHSSVGRAFNHIGRALEIETQPTQPEALVERAEAELGLSERTQVVAENLLGAVRAVNPAAVGAVAANGAASAAVYLAIGINDAEAVEPTQRDTADVFDTTAVTLRAHRDTFVDVLREHPELSGLPDPDGESQITYDGVAPGQFLDLEQVRGPPSAAPGESISEEVSVAADEERLEEAAVLFGDIRNFTSIVQLYEGAYGVVNELFERVEQRVVEQHGGEVDKLLGDGIMAVWSGETPRQNAVACAVDILESDLPEVRSEAPFELEMGFGVASGELRRVDIADVDRTVFGENVNLAARLEGLCKRFDADLIVDEQTSNALQEVPLYRLPNRELQGVNEPQDVFIHPNQHDIEQVEIDQFNQAAADLDAGFYAEALEFFASMYGDRAHPYNQTIVQRLAVECFDRFEQGAGESPGDRGLYTFTETQRQRSRPLKDAVERAISDCATDTPRVLEVGCEEGDLLLEIASECPGAEFVGVDTSPDAIETATESDEPHVEFRRTSPGRLVPEDAFDVVYLNSPLYSGESYLEVLDQVRELVADDGRLLTQQTPPGFNQKLRESAEEAAVIMGYESLFERFTHPIDFFGAEEIRDVHDSRDWDATVEQVEIDSDVRARIQDFTTTGLRPYLDRFSNAVEEQKFKSEFRAAAKRVGSDLEEAVFLVTAQPC